jgi:hypothetical protein
VAKYRSNLHVIFTYLFILVFIFICYFFDWSLGLTLQEQDKFTRASSRAAFAGHHAHGLTLPPLDSLPLPFPAASHHNHSSYLTFLTFLSRVMQLVPISIHHHHQPITTTNPAITHTNSQKHSRAPLPFNQISKHLTTISH